MPNMFDNRRSGEYIGGTSIPYQDLSFQRLYWPDRDCFAWLLIELKQYNLFPHMSVGQNLKFGLCGATRRSHNQRMQESLMQAGLSVMENRQPATLSLWNHQMEHANEIVGWPQYA